MDGSQASKPDPAVEDVFTSVFPHGLGGTGRNVSGSAIVGSYPLTEEHLAKLASHVESGASLGVTPESRAKMSRTHHRLAQFLANGMDEGKAGLLCNYNPATVSILKSDPMFQELVAYYAEQVDEAFVGVAEQMADLHDDVITELRKRLEEAPTQFTVPALTELHKALADRTGNGPTSNVNARVVAVSLNGDDIQRIKSTPAANTSDANRPTGVLTQANIRALEGVFTLSATDVAHGPPTQGEPPGPGVGLREANHQAPDDGVGPDVGVALP